MSTVGLFNEVQFFDNICGRHGLRRSDCDLVSWTENDLGSKKGVDPSADTLK